MSEKTASRIKQVVKELSKSAERAKRLQLSSLVAFVVAILFSVLVKLNLMTGVASKIISFTYMYNIVFAIFNLIPLPPLDGSKVLSALLPGRQSYWFDQVEPYAPFILMGLIYLGVIGTVIDPLERGLAFFIQGIVSILI